MEIHIALPGLIWPDSRDYNYLYTKVSFKYFDKLITKAKAKWHQFNYSDLIYDTEFYHNQSLAEGLVSKYLLENYQSYLIAEPTHLRADRDQLLIAESELLQLNLAESQELIASINEHFEGEIKLTLIKENLWLLAFKKDLGDLQTIPILQIIGENIDNYLPQGKNKVYLLKILNEIQMLLFNHPLNNLRKQDDLLTVNSLWLWDKQKIQLPFRYSRVLNTNSESDPYLSAKDIDNKLSENLLIIVDKAYYPSCYRDSYAWLDILGNLDKTLGYKLLKLLTTGKINRLNLWLPICDKTLQLQINRLDLLKFWRRQSLATRITKL